MPIKKSELYSSLWKSCDELRGGMDASQYKDYVLVLLFVKYVSDKAASQKHYDLQVPKGGGFADMVALKGQKDIGEGINKIIAKLAVANDLQGVINVTDFDDDDKLGKGKEKVDRLSNLIAIFENPALDFRSNRAEGDDLLGDAYEYLMRHFATESGKSKGQFYTPGEVSRIIAHVIGVNGASSSKQTIHDPTCVLGKQKFKAELIPPALLIARYFAAERAEVEKLVAEATAVTQSLEELVEEHSGDDGLLEDAKNDKDKVTKASVAARLKAIKSDREAKDERKVLEQYLALAEKEGELWSAANAAQLALTEKVAEKYGKLSEDEIKVLVIDDKWLVAVHGAVQSELDRVSQTLTGRVRELAERYATPLPELTSALETLAARVQAHLTQMGFSP